MKLWNPNQKAQVHYSRGLWCKTLTWETRNHDLDQCGTNVLGDDHMAAAMPPHSGGLTCTGSFLWGWKALQPFSQVRLTAVLLAVWNPGDRNPISSLHYVGGSRGESDQLFQHILSLKNQGQSKQGGAGCWQAHKALLCWVVRTVQLIQQQEGCHSAN